MMVIMFQNPEQFYGMKIKQEQFKKPEIIVASKRLRVFKVLNQDVSCSTERTDYRDLRQKLLPSLLLKNRFL